MSKKSHIKLNDSEAISSENNEKLLYWLYADIDDLIDMDYTINKNILE